MTRITIPNYMSPVSAVSTAQITTYSHVFFIIIAKISPQVV